MSAAFNISDMSRVPPHLRYELALVAQADGRTDVTRVVALAHERLGLERGDAPEAARPDREM